MKPSRCLDCGVGVRRRSPRAMPRPRCRRCAKAYRRSVDYRAESLARDGYDCARCLPPVNRLIAAFYAWRWAVLTSGPAERPLPPRRRPFAAALVLLAYAWLRNLDARADAWLRRFLRDRLRAHRYVEVDHIEALGAGGAQDPTNWQVLCKRHHDRKTRKDNRRMRGEWHLPRNVPVTLGVAGGCALLYLWLGLYALLGLSVPLAYLGVRVHARRAARERLHAALIEVTGAASTASRRALRRMRWRWSNPPGGWVPVARPREFTLAYPRNAPADKAEFWERLEGVAKTTLGGSWAVERHTERDRAHFMSPDPLAATSREWPWSERQRTSLWEPIPVGFDAYGRTLTMSLIERNLLVGGEPGSGKSVLASMPLAVAANDPTVTLYLADNKRVEMTPWAPCAQAFAVSQDDFIDVLRMVQSEINMRYELIAMSGGLQPDGTINVKRKVVPEDGFDPIFLGVDETAAFTDGDDRRANDEIVRLLRDVVSRGRAAAVVSMLATQIPGHDVIPTRVRNLIGYRAAFRSSTPEMSDQILGRGYASAGFDASRIDAATRGVGWLLTEGGVPRRFRSFHVTDEVLASLAGRAARLRGVGLAA